MAVASAPDDRLYCRFFSLVARQYHDMKQLSKAQIRLQRRNRDCDQGQTRSGQLRSASASI